MWAPIINLSLLFVAQISYGMRQQVNKSWSGSPTFDTTTQFLADHRYLMWIDQTAVPLPTTDFTLYTMLKYYGYDNDNSPAFWSVLSSSLFMLVIQIWAWLPFEADYSEKADLVHLSEFSEAYAAY